MSDQILERAKKIRLLILDIDGICTDGKMYYDGNGEVFKVFNGLDGLGIKLLQDNGIQVVIISSKESSGVVRRMHNLGVTKLYLGNENKREPYAKIKIELQLTDEQIAYMGDDLPDLPVMRQVGLAISVPNGAEFVKQHAHWVTNLSGGHGAVREACELILKAQDKWQTITNSYLA